MKKASLCLIAALMFIAFGCSGKSDNGGNSTETGGTITINTETGEETNNLTVESVTGATIPSQEEEQEPVVSVVKMPADFRVEYHFFADHQTDETILFLTTESVENFAYMEIIPAYDGDNIVLLLGETLFGLDDFTPEKPFVVSASIGSGIPSRGILFWYRGKVWSYYLMESGMDGSLMLIEFTPFMG